MFLIFVFGTAVNEDLDEGSANYLHKAKRFKNLIVDVEI